MSTLIAWSPMFVGLIAFPATQEFKGLDFAVMLCLGPALGAMIAGVVWSIVVADRGLHDCIAGTWVVPR